MWGLFSFVHRQIHHRKTGESSLDATRPTGGRIHEVLRLLLPLPFVRSRGACTFTFLARKVVASKKDDLNRHAATPAQHQTRPACKVERIGTLHVIYNSYHSPSSFILIFLVSSSFTKEWNAHGRRTVERTLRCASNCSQKGTWQKVAYHLSPSFRLLDDLEFQHFSAWLLLRKSL